MVSLGAILPLVAVVDGSLHFPPTGYSLLAMKAVLVLMILFAPLGCERRTVHEEERAIHAVAGWIRENSPADFRQVHSVTPLQAFERGILVSVEARYPPLLGPEGSLSVTTLYFVKESGEVEKYTPGPHAELHSSLKAAAISYYAEEGRP
ncbi:MAG: hypothetical protein AAF514_00065 [Verrucomicrobiota bacterium]